MQHRIEAALSTAGGDANRPVAVRAACFLAAAVFAGIVFAHFHNRQWNGYDDGAYLHVADCVLHGQVLNRDVQDIHAGPGRAVLVGFLLGLIFLVRQLTGVLVAIPVPPPPVTGSCAARPRRAPLLP